MEWYLTYKNLDLNSTTHPILNLKIVQKPRLIHEYIRYSMFMQKC